MGYDVVYHAAKVSCDDGNGTCVPHRAGMLRTVGHKRHQTTKLGNRGDNTHV